MQKSKYQVAREAKLLELYNSKDVAGLFEFVEKEVRRSFGQGANRERSKHLGLDKESVQ